jgi:putative endonuclease
MNPLLRSIQKHLITLSCEAKWETRLRRSFALPGVGTSGVNPSENNYSADRMFYVYVIRSTSNPERYYIGFTENIDQRIKEHNEGKSLHTAKYVPWEHAVYLAVPSKTKALELERYLKSGLGRAFLQRHIL